jgi:hypothetical protein
MSVHATNMLYLFVLILQSCCLCCCLFIFNCSHSLYAYYIYMIYMIHMFYVLMIHIVMDIFDIIISMINHLLYVIIIMLIYEIKMIWKIPIFLTIQKPNVRHFSVRGFAAVLKPDPFDGKNFLIWKAKMELWLTAMSCYHAAESNPVNLPPEDEAKFKADDNLFRGAVISALDTKLQKSYSILPTGKELWDALVGKFGVTDAGSKLYLMEQLYDYKMVENRSVVEQAHEFQALAKELELFPCPLPDKFVAGGIIAKLPPSWKDFATSLIRDKSSTWKSSLVLLMLRKGLEQRTMEKVLRPLLLIWCKRETSASLTRRKTRINKRIQINLFKHHHLKRRRTTTREREDALSVVVINIRLESAMIAISHRTRNQVML